MLVDPSENTSGRTVVWMIRPLDYWSRDGGI